ncbi:hypothetical protein, partial [Paracoccus versutus]|uniref:hypothetical protein n=1 Tax=Paracoccus versutus TaxID=34007 RepID=UPI001AA025FE
ILLHGVISLAVAAAGWVGVGSPGDYAAIQFLPLPRHDLSVSKIAATISALFYSLTREPLAR